MTQASSAYHIGQLSWKMFLLENKKRKISVINIMIFFYIFSLNVYICNEIDLTIFKIDIKKVLNAFLNLLFFFYHILPNWEFKHLQIFSEVAYKAKSREDIMHGFDEFLDQMTVLPPGQWDPDVRLDPPTTAPSQVCEASSYFYWLNIIIQSCVPNEIICSYTIYTIFMYCAHRNILIWNFYLNIYFIHSILC